MIAAEIIRKVIDAGGQITADGPDLVLTAPRPLPHELLAQIKAHKSDIVKVLGQPPLSKRRGLGGYGTPPGVPPLGGLPPPAVPGAPQARPGGCPALGSTLARRAEG